MKMLKMFAATLLALPIVAWSAEPAVDGDRFYMLTSELRCLVCQNESLADSNAQLALDLKNEIRARMAAGDSDQQIRSFLVERYGDFVSYRPPMNLRTLLLWLGPLLLAVGGGIVVWRGMRSSSKAQGAEEKDA